MSKKPIIRRTQVDIEEESIVGMFFHTFLDAPQVGSSGLQYQGLVTGRVNEGHFIVLLFSFMTGEPTERYVIPVAKMAGWKFYATADAWNDAYAEDCRRQERGQGAKPASFRDESGEIQRLRQMITDLGGDWEQAGIKNG